MMEVTDEVLIKECVSSLYRSISCEPGKKPDYDNIRKLFVDNAIMAEYVNKNSKIPNVKTIDEHIKEIENVFKIYPAISQKGFIENELSIKIMVKGPVATVCSEYEKYYYNGKIDMKNIGCNIFQMVKIDEIYKILSVSWYEK
jgi:hypothetical protein